jgi:tyrosyl-tRNA synthetase
VEDLEGMDGVTKFTYAADKINAGIDIVSFLAEVGIFPSKGEARKNVQGGGVSVNRRKVEDIQLTVNSNLLLHSQYLLVQKGKRNYYLVKVA